MTASHLLPLLLLAVSLAPAADAGRELHVAVGGDDAWNGRSATRSDGDGPFATVERAQEAARGLLAAGRPAGGLTIWIHPGTYELRKPLALGPEDSGSGGSPVTWRAAPGGEVRLSAGRRLPAFVPVAEQAILDRLDPAARGQVVMADLKALGITDHGEMSGGFGSGGKPGLELFVDDVPMTVARYPNHGFMRIAAVLGKEPVDVRGTKGCKEGILRFDDERVACWTAEKDAGLLGYWFWDWADQRQRIAAIDAATKVVTLTPPWHGYGYRAGQYCYGFNLLCEIDRPGEWCLDRGAGRLYVWPPAGATGRAVVSLLPAVVTLRNARHLELRGLVLEAARHDGVTVHGSTSVAITACTIRNHGGKAVHVDGGSQVSVIGCDITGTGDGGIELNGGERKTLTPGGHLAENNHIHHYSRWNRTYRPGIALGGVGNRAARNLIHHAPHQAMAFGGNEHVIEGNEIHNVCEETNDAGVIYAWNDWAGRGNVIRGNFIHHVYGHEGRGCMGVYLDDHFSSAQITGNLFVLVPGAVFLGGGRDHLVEGNCFVDCGPAVHVDARGLNWRAYGKDELIQKLRQQPIDQEPWKSRYPELLKLIDDEPMTPKGTRILRNLCVGGQWEHIEGQAKPYVTLKDNQVIADRSIFVDAEKGDYRLRPDAAPLTQGFVPLALGQMGLSHDPRRASWPVQHPVTRPEKIEKPW